jgi:hypothetical protein
MKPSKDDLIFPRFLIIANVEWDETGFREKDRTEFVLWADVVQLALVFEMTPTIAIVEPETYLAFRLKNPDLSVWIYSAFEGPFFAEIERRFGSASAPPVAEWKENDRCIVSYSIWPNERKGEPIYVNFYKSWWSSKAQLAFRKMPNQTLEPTALLGRGSP